MWSSPFPSSCSSGAKAEGEVGRPGWVQEPSWHPSHDSFVCADLPKHCSIPCGFPCPCPFPGTEMSCGRNSMQKCLVAALLGNCCPWKNRSLKTYRISGHTLLFWRHLCVFVSEEQGLFALWSMYWSCCRAL